LIFRASYGFVRTVSGSIRERCRRDRLMPEATAYLLVRMRAVTILGAAAVGAQQQRSTPNCLTERHSPNHCVTVASPDGALWPVGVGARGGGTPRCSRLHDAVLWSEPDRRVCQRLAVRPWWLVVMETASNGQCCSL
jgi:hypothetical protein